MSTGTTTYSADEIFLQAEPRIQILRQLERRAEERGKDLETQMQKLEAKCSPDFDSRVIEADRMLRELINDLFRETSRLSIHVREFCKRDEKKPADQRDRIVSLEGKYCLIHLVEFDSRHIRGRPNLFLEVRVEEDVVRCRLAYCVEGVSGQNHLLSVGRVVDSNADLGHIVRFATDPVQLVEVILKNTWSGEEVK